MRKQIQAAFAIAFVAVISGCAAEAPSNSEGSVTLRFEAGPGGDMALDYTGPKDEAVAVQDAIVRAAPAASADAAHSLAIRIEVKGGETRNIVLPVAGQQDAETFFQKVTENARAHSFSLRERTFPSGAAASPQLTPQMRYSEAVLNACLDSCYWWNSLCHLGCSLCYGDDFSGNTPLNC